MAKAQLSVAMIVRDEEARLASCLETVAPLADELVVVDTGSTDATVAIAESYGAEVSSLSWNGGFADPRNESLRRCSGDWILRVDADERVRCDPGRLREWISDDGYAAYWVMLQRRPGYTPTWQMRLHRNDARIRCEGKIHETRYDGLLEVCRDRRMSIGHADLYILHEGYAGDQTEKHRRNLPLLRETAAERPPAHAQILCRLAEAEEGLGYLDRAAAALHEALALARATDTAAADHSFVYAALVEFLDRQGLPDEGLADEGTERYPENLQLLWHQARIRMAEGRFGEAQTLLEQLIDRGRRRAFDGSVGYDERLLAELPEAALRICRAGLAGAVPVPALDLPPPGPLGYNSSLIPGLASGLRSAAGLPALAS